MYRTLPDGRPARRCLVRAQLLDLLHMGGRCSLSGLVRVQGQVARAESEVCKFCRSALLLQCHIIQLPSSAVHRMELLATLVRARSTLGVREATLAFAAASGRSAAGAVITCAAAGNAWRSNPSPGAPAPAAPTAYVSGLYVRTTPRLGLCAGGFLCPGAHRAMPLSTAVGNCKSGLNEETTSSQGQASGGLHIIISLLACAEGGGCCAFSDRACRIAC